MKDLLELYNKTKKIYSKLYDIHICEIFEIEDVIDFIDKYWKKNHILTKSKVLLDWQYYDKKNQRYNFVIARSKKTDEIHGIIGFIISSIYDENIKTPIRWGSIWKVRNDVALKGLGLVLKGYMEEKIPVDYIGGVGLTDDSKEIDAKLKEKVGKLTQYYIVNPYKKDYKLVVNPEISKYRTANIEKKILLKITESEFYNISNSLSKYMMPYKSINYYINRYFRHPIYTYNFMSVKSKNVPLAVFVYRKCNVNGANNIFIVDYIGKLDAMVGAYDEFVQLLRNEDAECISFPCYGISDIYLKSAGFCNRDDSNVILPVYYEPFMQENVDLDYHFWTSSDFKDEIIVKGDADQDRPNIL